MSNVKKLVKILVFVQCFLLFCTYNKGVVTTAQNELNLVDFIQCPFNEKFDSNTNLEKYVLKKFGKPDYTWKRRRPKEEHSEVIIDHNMIEYKNYKFDIYRGVNKRFEVFDSMLILEFTDLKYGINNKTSIKDIEKLFGKPGSIDKWENNNISFIDYVYVYGDDGPYSYRLDIRFQNGKLSDITIYVGIDAYKL